MKKTYLPITLVLFSLFSTLAHAQLAEGFESGNLNNWSLVTGAASLTGTPVFAGSSSLQMGLPNTPPVVPTLLVRQSFSGEHGRYQAQFHCEGTDSEFNFYFQFLNDSTYYQVTCRPLGTNAPELRLTKSNGDVLEILGSIGATFNLDTWHELAVERQCDNDILVFIDGIELININDQDITGAGAIALGAWTEFTYADEVRFEPFRAEVSIVGDTTFCNDPITLEASDIFSEYLWSDGSNRINADFDEQGIVSLEVVDFDGCKGRDSVMLLTYCPSFFFAPNIFTPNFDGMNDLFQLYPEKQIERFHLQVFDRYGELVFDAENVKEGWDGTFRGKSAPADMYLWIADMDGFTLSGSLVLLR